MLCRKPTVMILEPMEFIRHVYSSWYFRQSSANVLAFSLPKCEASFSAMLDVERSVPYASKAMMILRLLSLLVVILCCVLVPFDQQRCRMS